MPERQNEYFIPGDGISREVIQADICRYLGNDALVRPGTHNACPGFFIRAYRNLTSEMIADLKADSARWEADAVRRTNQGKSRGNYQGYYPNDYPMHDYPMHDYPIPPQGHNGPNAPPGSYGQPAPIHDVRPAPAGPSPPPATYSGPPAYSAPPSYNPRPSQPYMDHQYAQNPYGPSQSPPLSTTSSYPATHTHSPFSSAQSLPSSQTLSSSQNLPNLTSGQNPFPQQQMPPFSTATQPTPAVSADLHPSYKYAAAGFGFDNQWSNAPRSYSGMNYDNDSDYSPVTTAMNYPATTAADFRMPGLDARPPGIDARYTPETAYSGTRPQPQPQPQPQPATNRPGW